MSSKITNVATGTLIPMVVIVVLDGITVNMGCRNTLALTQQIAAAFAVGVARVAIGKFASSSGIADFCAANVVVLVIFPMGCTTVRTGCKLMTSCRTATILFLAVVIVSSADSGMGTVAIGFIFAPRMGVHLIPADVAALILIVVAVLAV